MSADTPEAREVVRRIREAGGEIRFGRSWMQVVGVGSELKRAAVRVGFEAVRDVLAAEEAERPQRDEEEHARRVLREAEARKREREAEERRRRLDDRYEKLYGAPEGAEDDGPQEPDDEEGDEP